MIKKINLSERDVYNKRKNIDIEEKIFFNFEKTIFAEKFINFSDMENILKYTKNIIENSLIELKRENRIVGKDEIKVNFQRGSFLFEVLVPLIVPYVSDIIVPTKEILFNFLRSFFNPLRIKHDDEGFQKMKSNPVFKNKNITGPVYNIVNNYGLNIIIGNSNNDKIDSINFDKEDELENTKENLERLNENEREIKTEKHIGKIIQANKVSKKKDLFQPKNSSKSVKIEFPNMSEEEKTKVFGEEEIEIIAETHYFSGEIEKLIVKEVMDSRNMNLLDFMKK